jgi:hypothetical protein
VIHIDERAMNRPGHIRRPNPKPTSGGFTLRSRKRSGQNRKGSGKTVSSCSTALKNQLRTPGLHDLNGLTTYFRLRCCLREGNSLHTRRPPSDGEGPLTQESELLHDGKECAAMRTEWRDRMPSHHFFNERRDVGQRPFVAKVGEPPRPHNIVYLRLCSTLRVRVKDHREKERKKRRDRLSEQCCHLDPREDVRANCIGST